MAQSPYYASHTWPTHVHREFPKWVGARLVGNADEEAAALADQPEHAPAAPLANANDIAELKAQVAALTALLTARAPSPEPVQVERPIAAPDAPVVAFVAPPNAQADARETLWADCEQRGIPYDRRWGVERVRAAIAAADVAEANA